MISEISFLDVLMVALILSIFSEAVSSMGGGGTKSSWQQVELKQDQEQERKKRSKQAMKQKLCRKPSPFFLSLLYGAANLKLIEPIETLQRKAVRLLARAKYNAHTDPLYKMHGILKLCDLISLDQTLFIRPFKNRKLPYSFHNFSQSLPLYDQHKRDDDYKLKQKHLADNSLSTIQVYT